MGKSKSIVTGLACAGLLLPANEAAGQGFIRDLAEYVLGIPNWQAQLHGGVSDFGRFLLQDVAVLNGNGDNLQLQRELNAENSFAFGGAFGGTFLPRTGFRLSASYTTTDLEYNDDTGIDSHLLDTGEVGDLGNFVLGFELMRYLLLEKAKLTPYGSGGLLLSWWSLDDQATGELVGEDTQFRLGAMGSLGLQYRMTSAFAMRLEAVTATIGNPFTGRDSFVPTTGFTIDEPARVRRTDYRLGLVYTFGRPDRPTVPIPTAK